VERSFIGLHEADMHKNERGSSDVIFILVVVLVAILAIIVWMNVSQGTPLGARLVSAFGSAWTWIRSFFNTLIARFN
jgi:bacteriorhodopsin